ncbi:MAG TPA: glycosyltransferase family 10 [Gammaproteobacteria bacterium]|nr:glycosyltransferase family 10 [Gammaproteobacteria bacterium]
MNTTQERKSELRIRLNMDFAPQGMELLTPGATMHWKDCAFDLNPPPGGRADFYVVLANAQPIDQCIIPRNNSLLITGEPPEKKIYPRKFYAQFSHIVDTHFLSNNPNVHLSAPGLNWHVGLDLHSRIYRYGYDHLAALAYPDKENKIAVVCSDAAFTPGQRKRLALLEFLKSRLGERMVHFGRGFTPINDKMDAILPYRFHLVLENSQSPHYWTEKLADAYLGWAFPLYMGCPNIREYFPDDSFETIDAGDFEAAHQRLLALLDSPYDAARIDAVASARELVLNHYNPFAWSAYWAKKLYQEGPEKMLTIRTHKAFRPFPRGDLYRLRRRFTHKLGT